LFGKLAQALVNAPFLIQLVALPFLVVYAQIHKRLYPADARQFLRYPGDFLERFVRNKD
jgi:hypothetical protein